MKHHKRSNPRFIFTFVLLAIFVIIAYATAAYYVCGRPKFVIAAKIQPVNIYIPKIVVAVGDISCDPTSQYAGGENPIKCQDTKVASAISAAGAEKILLLGDIQYDNGNLTKFQQAFNKNWGGLMPYFLPAPGNHEYETKGASGYFDYFNGVNVDSGIAGSRTQGFYKTSVGSWSLYSLNSNCKNIGGCEPGSPEYTWLEAELAKDKNNCKLAFWHHPIVSSSEHGAQPEETSRMVSIYSLLDAHKTSLVLNGHDHVYERFAPQNSLSQANANSIRQFTVGTGGKDLYKKVATKPNSEFFDNTNFGYLQLSLGYNSYNWRFNTTTGQVLDQGYSNCARS